MWREEITQFATTDLRRAAELPQDTPVVVAGLVSRMRALVSQKGKNPGAKMMILGLADKHATMEGVLFPDAFAKFGDLVAGDRAIVLIGYIDRGRGEPNIIIDRVIPLEDAAAHLGTRLEITIECGGDDARAAEGVLDMVAGLVKQASGGAALTPGKPVEVVIHLDGDARRVTLATHRLRVVPARGLLDSLRRVVGADRVRVKGGWTPERRKPKQWGGRPRSDEPVEV